MKRAAVVTTHKRRLAVWLVILISLVMVRPVFAANPIDVELPVQLIDSGSVAPGKTYTIRLTAKDAAYSMPSGAADGEYLLSAEAGTFMIPIRYHQVGTYDYIMKQLPGSDPLAQYDERTYGVRVFVSFTSEGSLEAAVVVTVEGDDNKAEAVEFRNHWTPTGSWAPKVRVLLDGRDMIPGEFGMILEDAQGMIQTITNRADGSFVFDNLIFYRAGVYEFTLRQPTGTAYAVSYDQSLKRISLIVKDNGDGTLSFEPSYEDDGIMFRNRFSVPTMDFTVTKKWLGGPNDKPMIRLQLLRDAKPYGAAVTLDNQTQYTWTGLDQTNASGTAYTYSVQEVDIPKGYTASYTVDGRTVINTWTGTLPETGIRYNNGILMVGLGLLMVALYLTWHKPAQ